jgi:hypothetical protein
MTIKKHGGIFGRNPTTSGDFLTVGEVTSGTADLYVSLTYIA